MSTPGREPETSADDAAPQAEEGAEATAAPESGQGATSEAARGSADASSAGPEAEVAEQAEPSEPEAEAEAAEPSQPEAEVEEAEPSEPEAKAEEAEPSEPEAKAEEAEPSQPEAKAEEPAPSEPAESGREPEVADPDQPSPDQPPDQTSPAPSQDASAASAAPAASEAPEGDSGAPTPGDSAESAGEEAPPLPRWKRWGRRLLRGVVALFVLGLVARVAFPFVFPPLLRFVGHQLELEVGYEELNLSLTSGELELRGLSVAQQSGEPLVNLRHLRVDVATSELLQGKVDVERVELDGLQLFVRRTPRGMLNWLEALEPLLGEGESPEEPAPEEPAPEEPEEPGAEAGPLLPDLSFLRLRGLRVEGVEVVLQDETVDPPHTSTLVLSAFLGPFRGAPEAPATAWLAEARAPGLLTLARAEGELRASQAGAKLTLNSKFEGLRYAPLREVLSTLGIKPHARTLAGRAQLSAALEPLPQEPRVLSLGLEVHDVALFADEGEVVALDRFALSVPRLAPDPEAFELEVSEVEVRGARARAGRSAEGFLQVAGLDVELPPEVATFPRPPRANAAPVASRASQQAKPGERGGAPSASAPSPSPAPLASPAPEEAAPLPAEFPLRIKRLALGTLRVSECEVSFRDAVVSPEPLRLGLESLEVKDVLWGEKQGAPASLSLRAQAPGILGTLAVVGSARAPTARSFRGGLRVEGSELCPRRLDPYLNALGVVREYEEGDLSLAARLELDAFADGALTGSFSLAEVSYRADGVEWLGLDELALEGLSLDLSGPRLELGALRVRAPRARAWRDRSGFGSCGFALRPELAQPAPAPAPAPSRPAPVTSAAPTPDAPAPDSGPEPKRAPLRGQFVLGNLSLEGAQLRFEDRVLERTHRVENLGCSLEDFRFDLDSTAPVSSRTLRGWLEVPGLVQRAELDLELLASLQAPALRGSFRAQGLSLEPLDVYLAPLGVEGLLREGTCEASFALRADLSRVERLELGAGLALERLVLREPERELLSLAGARLSGLEASPEAIRVGRIGLERFATRVELEERGTLLVPGLRLGVAPVSSARAAQVTGAGAGAGTSPRAPERSPEKSPDDLPPPLPVPAAHPLEGLELPRFELGALEVGELALDFRDARSGIAVPLRLQASGGPLRLDAAAPAPSPGPLQARLRAPGLFRELSLQATLGMNRDRLLLSGNLDLAGIDAAAVRESLERAGLGLAFAEGGGTFQTGFGVQLELAPGRLGLAAWAEELRLRDAEREWLGLDRAGLALSLTPETLTLGPSQVEAPRLLVRRGAAGLEVAGLRLLSAPPAPEGSAPQGPAPEAPQPERPSVPPPAPGLEPIPAPTSLPDILPERVRARLAALGLPTFELSATTLSEARLTFEDTQTSPPETLELKLAGAVGPATISPRLSLSPLPYRLDLRLPGVLAKGGLSGEVQGDLDQGYRLTGELGLEGLQAGPLARVLPPELGVELKEGKLGARYEAGLGLHPERGLQARGALTQVSLREGERALLQLSEASFRLRQLAPGARVVDLESVVLGGLEVQAELDEAQALHVLGLRLGPPPGSPPAAGPAPQEGGAAPPQSPSEESGQASAPAPRPAEREVAKKERLLARLSRRAARRLQAELPEFNLERVEVGLRRVALLRPKAAPLVLADLKLRNTAPLQAPAGDLANAPPWVFRTELGVAPILSQVVVEARLRPFALHPAFHVAWELSGIQGAGIRAALPELEGTVLDGPRAALTKGELRAELVTGRREPLNFHFAETGFGARLELSGVEFREAGTEGEAPLAGLERLSVDVTEIHPQRGVVVSQVEVVRPQGRFHRDARGLHALGFTIPIPEPPPEEAQQDSAPAANPQQAPAPAATPRAPATEGAAPKPFEVRVDKVTVSKIDVAVIDQSYDPPVRIPVRDLELELSDLSTKLLSEKGELQLELEVKGGLIPIPGQEAQVPAWERIFLGLRASAFPKPSATLDLEVRQVQLTNYAGLAKDFGVDLDGGRVDVEATIRLSEDMHLNLSSMTSLHDLALSEGEKGPLRSWLGIPFPVGFGISAAQKVYGSTLRVPLDPSPLDLNDLSLPSLLAYGTAQIPRLFGEAFATLLIDAVTQLPRRAVTGLRDLGKGIGGIVGLTSSDEDALVNEIAFPAGVESLGPRALEEARSIRARLQANSELRVQLEHSLGKADLARAKRLARPPVHDRLALARRGEARVQELRRELLILEAEAAEHQAAGSERAFQTTRARFQALAQRLARAEAALDEAYALLDESPDAPRRVAQTCVALGQLRLEALQRVVVGEDPALAKRVTLRRVRFEPEPEREVGGVLFNWRE